MGHVTTMDRIDGINRVVTEFPIDATLKVTRVDKPSFQKLCGLGFVAIMSLGMQH